MNNIEKMHRRSLLAESFLFQDLPKEDLDRIVEFTTQRNYKAREIVVNQYDPGSEIFFIVNGRVSLTTTSLEGKELLIDILSTGDMFGEIAFFDDKDRTATVTTIDPSEFLVLERGRFMPFIKKQPDIAVRLVSALASRLRRTNKLLEDNLLQHVPERLARKFIQLSHDFGERADEGIRINIKLSQRDIGKMTSSSREGVNKQMKIWEEAGILNFVKGYLTITDITALYDIAGQLQPVGEKSLHKQGAQYSNGVK